MKQIQKLQKACLSLAFGTIFALLFTGCGTISDTVQGKNGRHVNLELIAGNSAAKGADYKIQGDNKKWELKGKIPASVPLSRSMTRGFSVEVEKPGYLKQVKQGRMIIDAGGKVGLVLDGVACMFPVFGITGGAIDYFSGAGRQLDQPQMTFMMEPDGSPPSNYVMAAPPAPTQPPQTVVIQNQIPQAPPPTIIQQSTPAPPARVITKNPELPNKFGR